GGEEPPQTHLAVVHERDASFGKGRRARGFTLAREVARLRPDAAGGALLTVDPELCEEEAIGVEFLHGLATGADVTGDRSRAKQRDDDGSQPTAGTAARWCAGLPAHGSTS